MSPGDLGSEATDVDTRLAKNLELCRMWRAMMLLDEADVFLGARTLEGFARNELVSSPFPPFRPTFTSQS